jgi:outer membrane receptor protein involved in Fe transport
MANHTFDKLPIIAGLAVSMVLGAVPNLQAQQLEEIVVTAQRREQSLQDVPVSLQTFSGDDMSRQGFDTLESLSTFAPGLVIKAWSEEQGLILRGAGTQSKNLGIEQGVPTFIDGIHMGRGSQVLSSYLDVQRVEVLKGPQPVFFGQNAAAGALNIETRKPGDEWEGTLSGDFGNFGKQSVEGAFGGPITDTFGVRVAGKYYRLEGFMRDYFTGKKFPQREYQTFRVTTQWNPTDNFEATFKYEVSDNDLGPRVQPVVLESRGTLAEAKLTHGLSSPITGILSANVPPVDLKIGEFSKVGILYDTFLNPRVESDLREAAGLPRLTEASGSNSGIVMDLTQCYREGGLRVFRGGDALVGGGTVVGPSGSAGIQPVLPYYDNCDMKDRSGSKPWHSILDLTYRFDNDIEITSKTAFSSQEFWNSPYNSGGGAFITNARQRGEFFGQWSEEVRISSPTGGTIEWMAGLYWQENNLEAWSDAYRSNSRNPIRSSRTFEEAKWISGFVALTFNLLDNFSLDAGARYTDISKRGGGTNRIAEWIVEDSITGDYVQLPYGLDFSGSSARNARAAAYLTANPGLVNPSIVGRTLITDKCGTYLADNDPNRLGSLGLSHCVTQDLSFSDDSFDPQVVFRYRPSDDVSLYAKYATSFKSGGYDMGVSELPLDERDFSFGPEQYEIFEVGMRGTFMDGRLAAELTAFATDIEGTQVSFVDRSEGRDRNVTQNVGGQKSDGIELSATFAATDRLTLRGYLALLDGVILDFTTSVCTDDDRLAGRCVDRDGNPALGSTPGAADRSGQESRNAPNWQYTGNIRYELPTILQGIKSNFDATVTGTSAYTTDRSFSNVYSYDSAWDVNLSYQFGDEEDRWSVLVYGRNLMAAKPVYHAELDFAGEGVSESSAQVTMSNFATYGARVTYNFF